MNLKSGKYDMVQHHSFKTFINTISTNWQFVLLYSLPITFLSLCEYLNDWMNEQRQYIIWREKKTKKYRKSKQLLKQLMQTDYLITRTFLVHRWKNEKIVCQLFFSRTFLMVVFCFRKNWENVVNNVQRSW